MKSARRRPNLPAHAAALILVGLVALGAVSCSSNPPASPSIPGAHAVVVLGDSLAVTPAPQENFPAVLQPRVAASVPGSILTNSSVPGDTTSKGLQRFDASVPGGTTIMVLELGANDGLDGVNVTTIEQNLSTMIERAKARGIKVLLCGMETFPTYGVDYSTAFHNIFPRLASSTPFRWCRSCSTGSSSILDTRRTISCIPMPPARSESPIPYGRTCNRC